MARDKSLTGAAGAYYVGFRLSALGYAVGLTTYGTRAIDLLVANPDTLKSVTIQTKTMFEDALVKRKDGTYRWKWQVGVKALRRPVYATFFYAFVDLKGDPSQTPDVFIVPSGELSDLLTVFPEVDPESPEVTSVWCDIFKDDAPKYKNRWDVINDALA